MGNPDKIVAVGLGEVLYDHDVVTDEYTFGGAPANFADHFLQCSRLISGPDAALADLAARLAAAGVETQRIAIDIAAHSRMLEPILTPFGDYLRSITLNPPKLPIISNRTGVELTPAQATDPEYWVQHLRNTVNFQPCMATLMADGPRVFMEMGPGRAMSSLAQAIQQPTLFDANNFVEQLCREAEVDCTGVAATSDVPYEAIIEAAEQINREQGTSLLIVEQDVEVSLSHAHRGYVLDTGRITRNDDAQTLLHDDYVRSAYLGL